ncbi:Aste57867_15756 [Aphanomyces stellatus]|uniref:Aste57867_1043 protein n=1 Tax=Aphanomyces stellatus TaxID=120398 RepID=A0A485K9B3_9STRA|nr:hypothetical protein As57867_015700 [Aphanomyces stellatus]KAF0719447.1 hypothetical protein As57867_001042 [Aphanomyces stellatus]VFT78265.1 Aste57867_1043 [Aphanomyces stellatus]VFT92545.1 Aste57867_15756 [Aphanomyces stellatus]
MCQAPSHFPQHLMKHQMFRLRRLQRRAQIRELLSQSQKLPLNDASCAALAIKLERILHRTFPGTYGYLPDEVLDLKLRHIAKGILTTNTPCRPVVVVAN